MVHLQAIPAEPATRGDIWYTCAEHTFNVVHVRNMDTMQETAAQHHKVDGQDHNLDRDNRTAQGNHLRSTKCNKKKMMTTMDKMMTTMGKMMTTMMGTKE